MRYALPRPALLKLAGTGAVLGPACDAIHNQLLLEYDVLPVSLLDGAAKTSLLIPPLLALTYSLLGGVAPVLARRIAPGGFGGGLDDRLGDGLAAPLLPDARGRALAAVVLTCSVIKLSAVLIDGGIENAFPLLAAAALAQWLVLDGSWAALGLGLLVGVAGPLAEIPFMELGLWHYLAPDYYPFGADAPGLSSLTGPCYFAVTQDAAALGRLFDDSSPEK
mmetsp:Transcript_8816/g.27555  ORF Transcript_8816/g.27555 Transcript_8816/m.27555 type:complete len:221 (+) Transcript_8816:90-752(+)